MSVILRVCEMFLKTPGAEIVVVKYFNLRICILKACIKT